MCGNIPDDFETSLYIALKLVPRSAKVDLAGKLPDQSDRGCTAIARALVAHLRRTGVTVTFSPPISIHWTAMDDKWRAK